MNVECLAQFQKGITYEQWNQTRPMHGSFYANWNSKFSNSFLSLVHSFIATQVWLVLDN